MYLHNSYYSLQLQIKNMTKIVTSNFQRVNKHKNRTELPLATPTGMIASLLWGSFCLKEIVCVNTESYICLMFQQSWWALLKLRPLFFSTPQTVLIPLCYPLVFIPSSIYTHLFNMYLCIILAFSNLSLTRMLQPQSKSKHFIVIWPLSCVEIKVFQCCYLELVLLVKCLKSFGFFFWVST